MGQRIRMISGPFFGDAVMPDKLAEAKVLVEGWRKEYNRFRPPSSLGYKPPGPVAIMAGIFTQGLEH